MDGMKKSNLAGSGGRLKALAGAIWQNALRLPRRVPRRLRLCESLPLGEHRFVAVVELDGEGFLLGGTSASLVLLARLEGAGGKAEAVRPTSKPEERVTEIGGDRRPRIEAC
jgi:Flagellar biosynthesis protein, FliO